MQPRGTGAKNAATATSVLAQLVSKTGFADDTCTQTPRRQNLAHYVRDLMRSTERPRETRASRKTEGEARSSPFSYRRFEDARSMLARARKCGPLRDRKCNITLYASSCRIKILGKIATCGDCARKSTISDWIRFVYWTWRCLRVASVGCNVYFGFGPLRYRKRETIGRE